MKTGISAELAAHYASGATTLATLWRATRKDGQVLAFTDHDQPIAYDGTTFAVSSSYDASANSTTATMGVDNMELKGLLAVDAVTARDIEAGLWDGAQIELMEVNYRDLTMGHNDLRFGEIGEVQRKEGQQFTAELRGLMQYLQNIIGRVVTPACDADLGDARCGVDKEALRVAGVVSSVTSNRVFTALAGTTNDETYSLGVITWTSGANDGLSMEMKALAAGAYTLQLDMPNDVAIGDAFTIVPGCNKIGRLGHCKLVYNNYNRFRGFEDLPGQNQILKVGGR